ncbi:ABC transporter permease [Bdellovibrio sp. BCCA]|uniref:ABC transporter permease n=1 Tax=Bdellovibrio sp. BCCA TaxID=3136281 RepID=UPI0030F30520
MKWSRVCSIFFLVVLVVLWEVLSRLQVYREDFFPYLKTFIEATTHEISSGRLLVDLMASLYRWVCGFLLSALVGIPVGLLLGRSESFRQFISPYLNFFRSLSPLAWIPFAVIWFGIGDMPVIFLIFLGCVFPLLFATMNAVFHVPKVYDQLARDYHFSGAEYFFEILFPAVLPQIVSSLRLVSGLAWIVLVPAEMLAGKEGVGFAISDARNGMRTDLLVLNMIVIAVIAHFIDYGLQRLNRKSHVRWSYEQ